MKNKLFDSELHIMQILWKEGDTPAKHIAELMANQTGWSKTTTYTVIKKCIDKGAIERREPEFICHALISRKEAQQSETGELVEKLFDGKADHLVASILGNGSLSSAQIAELKKIIDDLE